MKLFHGLYTRGQRGFQFLRFFTSRLSHIGSAAAAAACAWGQLAGDAPVSKGDALFPRLSPRA